MTTVTMYAIKAEFDDVVRYVGRECRPDPSWNGDRGKTPTIIEPMLRTYYMPAFEEPGAIKYREKDQAQADIPRVRRVLGDFWKYRVVRIAMEWGEPQTARLA